MGSSTCKAWMVAASIGAVEALKDQMGICRWNYAIRSVQQHLKNNVRSVSHTNKISSQTSAAFSTRFGDDNRAKQAEESLRKVMYLSCWGPN